MPGLWGDEFEIDKSTQNVLDKVNNPKQVKSSKKVSNKLSLEDRLAIIKEEVYKVLGQHRDDTLVIYSRDVLHDFISKAIENGFIAIDTETNKSLDPLTCKLVGPCLYTKGQKQVYVPLCHVDKDGNLLPSQLTTKDIKEEFDGFINCSLKADNEGMKIYEEN